MSKPKVFTVADTLWQDSRDQAGDLTCRVCEDVVRPADHESHVAAHNREGWVDLR